VIVAAIPDSWMLSYLPVMRSVDGKARPNKLHWLLATTEEAQYERLGPNRLRVTCAQGFFDRRWFERNSHQPLHRGERIQLSEMTVTVREITEDGRPIVCDFVFSQPLESAKYRWLTWHQGRLEPFRPPREQTRSNPVPASQAPRAHFIDPKRRLSGGTGPVAALRDLKIHRVFLRSRALHPSLSRAEIQHFWSMK
jgi:hypothetical protein